MLNIGRINKLKANRKVDFGMYLDAGDKEILLPAKYMPEGFKEGDEIDVFIYNDSQDRPIATTETPKIMVGEFAFLNVKQVNSIGAFMDWGITAKDLLIPFSEQKNRITGNGRYLVYAYLDDTTKRIVGSTKLEKYLGNVLPHYQKGDEVETLIIEQTPIGYRCIVDNLHYGMIYANELYSPIHIGQKLTTFVKNVREDGKIDLSVQQSAGRRTNTLADDILIMLKDGDGTLPFNDKSSPEEITKRFGCSKKDFKKAIGHLYKGHKIDITEKGIKLIKY